jgi:hypothetical protein
MAEGVNFSNIKPFEPLAAKFDEEKAQMQQGKE